MGQGAMEQSQRNQVWLQQEIISIAARPGTFKHQEKCECPSEFSLLIKKGGSPRKQTEQQNRIWSCVVQEKQLSRLQLGPQGEVPD